MQWRVCISQSAYNLCAIECACVFSSVCYTGEYVTSTAISVCENCMKNALQTAPGSCWFEGNRWKMWRRKYLSRRWWFAFVWNKACLALWGLFWSFLSAHWIFFQSHSIRLLQKNTTRVLHVVSQYVSQCKSLSHKEPCRQLPVFNRKPAY